VRAVCERAFLHSVVTEEYTLKDRCCLEFGRLLRKQSWDNHLDCELNTDKSVGYAFACRKKPCVRCLL